MFTKPDNHKLLRFQSSINALRFVAGLTAKELADIFGVTIATIYSLENNHNNITFAQYYAFRYVFDYLALENDNLKKAIYILVDSENVTYSDKLELMSKCDQIKTDLGKRYGVSIGSQSKELKELINNIYNQYNEIL